jgi:hypothetical protein
MNWNRLNALVPKRWVLLLRYYLPFFKKPESSYFRLRQFINKKVKIKASNTFDITLFSEFLTIINNYSISDNLRKMLITSIMPNDSAFFDQKILKQIFNKFQPNDDNRALISFLNQLPSSIFEHYLQYLCCNLERLKNPPSFYKQHIAWCAKLNAKFSMEGTLRMLSILPAHLIEQTSEPISTLAMHKIDDIALYLEKLTAELKNEVLLFYLRYQLNVDDPLFFEFLNQLFVLEPEKAYSFFSDYLMQHPIEKQLVIIEKMHDATPKEGKETRLTKIVNNYLEKTQASSINYLINYAFHNKNAATLSILSTIQENLENYSLNFFRS